MVCKFLPVVVIFAENIFCKSINMYYIYKISYVSSMSDRLTGWVCCILKALFVGMFTVKVSNITQMPPEKITVSPTTIQTNEN